MTKLTRKARPFATAIVAAVLGGGVTFWLIRSDETREFDALKTHALCVLQPPEGSESTSAQFTIQRPVKKFHVGIRSKTSGDTFTLTISGDQGVVCRASGVKAHLFGLGRNIEPGSYTATLHQKIEGNGGVAVIATEQPVYVTGWQVLSRTCLGLLAVSGLGVALGRKSTNSRAGALSHAAFHNLLLAMVLILVYLLFHGAGMRWRRLLSGVLIWRAAISGESTVIPIPAVRWGRRLSHGNRASFPARAPYCPRLQEWFCSSCGAFQRGTGFGDFGQW